MVAEEQPQVACPWSFDVQNPSRSRQGLTDGKQREEKIKVIKYKSSLDDVKASKSHVHVEASKAHGMVVVPERGWRLAVVIMVRLIVAGREGEQRLSIICSLHMRAMDVRYCAGHGAPE